MCAWLKFQFKTIIKHSRYLAKLKHKFIRKFQIQSIHVFQKGIGKRKTLWIFQYLDKCTCLAMSMSLLGKPHYLITIKKLTKLQFLEQTTKEPQLIPKYLCTIFLSRNYDRSNIYISHRFEHENSFVLPPFVPIIYITVYVCAVVCACAYALAFMRSTWPIHFHSVKQYLDVKANQENLFPINKKRFS